MATKRETLHIPDMHCDGCAARITNALERLDGVGAAGSVPRAGIAYISTT